MSQHVFVVPIDKNSEDIVKGFKTFVSKVSLSELERSKLVSAFNSEALPGIARTLSLRAAGSDIKFSKTLTTADEEFVITFDTTKRSILQKIKAAFTGV